MLTEPHPASYPLQRPWKLAANAAADEDRWTLKQVMCSHGKIFDMPSGIVYSQKRQGAFRPLIHLSLV
jgi:hypothetical protein